MSACLVAIEDHDVFVPLGIYESGLVAEDAVEAFVKAKPEWNARPWTWTDFDGWKGTRIYRQETNQPIYYVDYHSPIILKELPLNELRDPTPLSGALI